MRMTTTAMKVPRSANIAREVEWDTGRCPWWSRHSYSLEGHSPPLRVFAKVPREVL